MSSDEEMSPKAVAEPVTIPKPKNKGGRPRHDPVDIGEKEVILTKPPRKPRVLTAESKAKIDAGRAKALATLTEQRRQKALEKEEINKVVEEKKKEIQASKPPKVDDVIMTMKKEMEELKKQLQTNVKAEPEPEKPKRKVKKIVYEDEDDESEGSEVEEVKVIRRKKTHLRPKAEVSNAPLEGRALLDHLFFGKK